MSADIADRLLALPGAAQHLRTGQSLFRRGDAVQRIFVVRQGGIHLLRHAAEGGAIVLQRAGPASIVAEASLFSARYHCDAVAFAPTRLHSIRKSAVSRAWREAPDFALAFAAQLAREVQQARLRAEILALKKVTERLNAWLAWNDGALPPKGCWRLVAMEIGVSPEALYREIGRRRPPQQSVRRCGRSAAV